MIIFSSICRILLTRLPFLKKWSMTASFVLNPVGGSGNGRRKRLKNPGRGFMNTYWRPSKKETGLNDWALSWLSMVCAYYAYRSSFAAGDGTDRPNTISRFNSRISTYKSRNCNCGIDAAFYTNGRNWRTYKRYTS